jgi:hypothetical protein
LSIWFTYLDRAFVGRIISGVCDRGFFLKFLDDSLGHDRPDALDETEPIYFSMPVTEAGTNIPFRGGE